MKKIPLSIFVFSLYSFMVRGENHRPTFFYKSGPPVPQIIKIDPKLPLLNMAKFRSNSLIRNPYVNYTAMSGGKCYDFEMPWESDFSQCYPGDEKYETPREKSLYHSSLEEDLWHLGEERSPLHQLEFENTHELLKLIHSGIPINGKTMDAITPLHEVARVFSNADYAEILLDHGAEVNAVDYKNITPLQHPAEACNLEVVELLIQHGADVNNQDVDGQTALHAAVQRDDCLPVVKALLANGARMDLRTWNRQTPLYQAVLNKHNDISQLILSQLMIAEAVRIGDRENMHRLFLEHETTLHARLENGATLLHIAAEKDHFQIVFDLLNLGADPNAQDDEGYRPYHYGIRGGRLYVRLLPYSAAVDEPIGPKKQTSLHLAAEYGRAYIIERLINEYDADIDVCDAEGHSPLDLATMRGHAKAVDTLLKKGADRNACDSYDLSERDLEEEEDDIT